MRVLSLLLVAVAMSPSTAGPLVPGQERVDARVELTIDEPYEDRGVAWPVTTGVPFPRGQLKDVREICLVDEQGVVTPLQTRAAAQWLPEMNSIRWLTIDFIAEPGKRYWLELTPGIQQPRYDSSLEISQLGKSFHVSTGVISAEFHTDGPAPLAAIRADLNGDQQVDAEEVVLTATQDGEHYYANQHKQRFSNARDADDRQIVVESSGPIRACVRIDGFYTGPDGERIVRYRTRYHFFNRLGLIKVINEFKIVGSTKQTQFHDIGFELKLAGDPQHRTVAVDRSGAEGNQTLTAKWQSDTQSISSFQSTYRHFGNPECRGRVVELGSTGERELHASDHVGEWMQVLDDRAAVTGSLRWFWQQFPKEWEVTRDRMVLHLWSPRGGPLDFGRDGLRERFGERGAEYILNWKGVRGTLNPISNFFYFAGHGALSRGDVDGKGINKHHEFYWHVAPSSQTAAGKEYGRLAAKPPLAMATGEWNCSTDVFGPLASRPNSSKYEAIVDRIFDLGREVQDTFGDYGWCAFGSGPHYSYQWDEQTKRHYADPRRFEYHTYQKETQLWWCYLRSGERKFYDWAIESEDHWTDIAVTHVPLTYECDWRGGFRQKQTLRFRPGDWSIDSAMFYVRQRDSAEAWLRGGSQFWASYHRTLETTTLAYYLTGDERYNDVLNYWRDYWRDLAGKTSASPDFKPWHREQPWYQPNAPNEPTKTWAEMIRDYAPFTSGLRHQMTQFFNLATLYEHTQDPAIRQVLEECADAYLEPEHRIGVWRTQENGLPNHADAPLLGHFWVPAMWKYERATGDPRMSQVFRRYFDACYAADPFREDIGRYSNVHLAYAYYYTRDPRHLRPAQIELDRLMPNAEPLARPEDLGQRLYNPYAPIQALTAVPRLVWALDEAKRHGDHPADPPPLKPQRTAIGIEKNNGDALHLSLWGYEEELRIIGPDDEPFVGFKIVTQEHASDIQPFDRNLRNFEVFLHELTIPADAPAGFYVLAPKLELAVLVSTNPMILVNAARPVALETSESCSLTIPVDWKDLQLLSADPTSIRIADSEGRQLETTGAANRLSLVFPETERTRIVHIRNEGQRKAWFQVGDRPAESCWVAFGKAAPVSAPSREQTVAAVTPSQTLDVNKTFPAGRFGEAIQIVPQSKLRFPDHVAMPDRTVRLFDLKQGTIEFWVKKQWDERLVAAKPITFLSNGLVSAWCPWKLPGGEWAHVAVEWRPLKRDPDRQAVHIYVNGHDQRNYRSTWWEGYSQRPLTFTGKEWLKEFVCTTQADAPFIFDELRISNVPRYADLEATLGGQQTFNPSRFAPPQQPFSKDDHTLLLFRFDKDLIGEGATIEQTITAELTPAGKRE
ncbi:MAG: hypothetical protein CMJ64_18155 [Planctomycetaceae bacterium]|nr:hypothetical protein [Planctomycetaceae bacterium]